MTDELDRKGLGMQRLLDMEFPGDLTLGEAKKAIYRRDYWRALCGMAKEPDRVELLFGWRYPDGKEEFAPDDCRIDRWRSWPESEPFISITDGSGGVGVTKTPEPELV